MNGGSAVLCAALLLASIPYVALQNLEEATTPRTLALTDAGSAEPRFEAVPARGPSEAGAPGLPPSTPAPGLGAPVALGAEPMGFTLGNRFGDDLQEVAVTARFSGDLPSGAVLQAGVRGPDGIAWTTVHSPEARRAGVTPGLQAGDWAPGWLPLEDGRVAGPASPEAPRWAAFASDDPLAASDPATPADLAGLAVPAAGDAAPTLPGTATLAGLGLRGDVKLLVLPAAGGRIRVATVDNNVDAGADGWDFTVSALDGTVLAKAAGGDDGVADRTRKATRGTAILDAPFAAGHWYLLTGKPRSFDSVVAGIEGLRSALLLDEVYLAGSTWGAPVPAPLTLRLDSTGGLLQAFTPVDAGLQTLTVRRSDGWSETLKVEARRVAANLTLEPGSYTVTVPSGHVRLTHRGGLFSADGSAGPVPVASGLVRSDATSVTVESALRGNPVLWTYASTPDLRIDVAKQDLNWHEGADDLTVILRDAGLREVARATLPDDGHLGSNGTRAPAQNVTLRLDGAAPGPYRIDFRGSADYLLRRVAVDQPHLVASTLLTVGDHACCFPRLPRVDNGLTLTYGALAPGNVTASTPHATGVQQLRLSPLGAAGGPVPSGPRGEIQVEVLRPGNQTTAWLGSGLWSVDVPVQDVALAGPGYFAFTPSSFFFPYLRERVLPGPGQPAATHILAAADPAAFAQQAADGSLVATFTVPGDAAADGVELLFRVRARGTLPPEPAVALTALEATLQPKPLARQSWWR